MDRWWHVRLIPVRHWAAKLVHYWAIILEKGYCKGNPVHQGLLEVQYKHQRPYPRAHLQSVFCNWNLELLSSLITREPSHASLCPFLIILLVIKTCWQAKLLSWVGAPLINLSSFHGHIMLFSLPLMQSQSLTLDTKSHQGSSESLWIHGKY